MLIRGLVLLREVMLQAGPDGSSKSLQELTQVPKDALQPPHTSKASDEPCPTLRHQRPVDELSRPPSLAQQTHHRLELSFLPDRLSHLSQHRWSVRQVGLQGGNEQVDNHL